MGQTITTFLLYDLIDHARVPISVVRPIRFCSHPIEALLLPPLFLILILTVLVQYYQKENPDMLFIHFIIVISTLKFPLPFRGGVVDLSFLWDVDWMW